MAAIVSPPPTLETVEAADGSLVQVSLVALGSGGGGKLPRTVLPVLRELQVSPTTRLLEDSIKEAHAHVARLEADLLVLTSDVVKSEANLNRVLQCHADMNSLLRAVMGAGTKTVAITPWAAARGYAAATTTASAAQLLQPGWAASRKGDGGVAPGTGLLVPAASVPMVLRVQVAALTDVQSLLVSAEAELAASVRRSPLATQLYTG